MAPHTPQCSERPGKAVALAHKTGGPEMAPRPPDVRSAPAKPWRSSIQKGGRSSVLNQPLAEVAPGHRGDRRLERADLREPPRRLPRHRAPRPQRLTRPPRRV